MDEVTRLGEKGCGPWGSAGGTDVGEGSGGTRFPSALPNPFVFPSHSHSQIGLETLVCYESVGPPLAGFLGVSQLRGRLAPARVTFQARRPSPYRLSVPQGSPSCPHSARVPAHRVPVRASWRPVWAGGQALPLPLVTAAQPRPRRCLPQFPHLPWGRWRSSWMLLPCPLGSQAGSPRSRPPRNAV